MSAAKERATLRLMTKRIAISSVLLVLAASCDGGERAPDPSAERTTAVVPSRSDSAPIAPTSAAASTPPREASAPVPKTPLPSERLAPGLRKRPLEEQREYLALRLAEEFDLDPAALAEVKRIVEASDWMSFGHPKVSEPSMTQEECRERRSKAARLHAPDPECPQENMVLVYDPKSESKTDAKVCIDQYEFPNIPCEYPIVWVRASEASAICQAQGKRLCWAHEWEGACAGALLPTSVEYPYASLGKYLDEPSRLRERRVQLEHLHDKDREVRWAYGKEKNHALCATGGRKSPTCSVIDFGTCGSNHFPTGAFPDCVSPFGVYDQHGNAAEHMSLPVYPEELAKGPDAGWTEMKGSWFIFATEEAHPDDCRWRARNWHTTRINERLSHRNYHLGFRCCADVKGKAP